MPRLRHLKNYEEIITDDDIENNKRETSMGREGEGISGSSWLSNSVIIGSMPEDKIKQAISYHNTMANLLENELKLRTIATSIYIARDFNNFRVTSKANGYSNRMYDNEGQKVKRRSNRNKGIFKGLRLTPELREALLQCLEELRT